jgi:hypothetical protein
MARVLLSRYRDDFSVSGTGSDASLCFHETGDVLSVSDLEARVPHGGRITFPSGLEVDVVVMSERLQELLFHAELASA